MEVKICQMSKIWGKGGGETPYDPKRVWLTILIFFSHFVCFDIQSINEDSLKRLNSYLEDLQKKNPVSPTHLMFYLKNGSEQEEGKPDSLVYKTIYYTQLICQPLPLFNLHTCKHFSIKRTFGTSMWVEVVVVMVSVWDSWSSNLRSDAA